MIVVRSPLRLSLAGGGSDLPSYLETSMGRVLSLTINKYVYLAMHDLFSGGIRVSYSLLEHVENINHLNHPIFRETMQELRFSDSVEIGSFADVPGNGTGLGSSSAFTNALILGLKSLQGEEISKPELARLACKIEIKRCMQPIGYQDQWASAIGGINEIIFHNLVEVSYNTLNLRQDSLDILKQSLKLYYLGQGRNAGNILRVQNSNIRENKVAKKAQDGIVKLVTPTKEAIVANDISLLGNLLHEGWMLKREMTEFTSSPFIDEVYEFALASGAAGGKVLGAGGGGFILLCVPPENLVKFEKSFRNLRRLDFDFDFDGTRVVFKDG